MKLRNVSTQPVTVHDEHAGRGALVEPGGEFDASEQTARELLELRDTWAPVETAPVRTSGKRKAGST